MRRGRHAGAPPAARPLVAKHVRGLAREFRVLQPLSVRDVEQVIVHLEERLELDEVDPTAPSVQAVGFIIL